MSREKGLKEQVESQLSDMLESRDEPSEGRMKLLKLGITMLAVNAKLEENEFGAFFEETGNGTGASGVQKQQGEKPSGRRRTNGDAGDGES